MKFDPYEYPQKPYEEVKNNVYIESKNENTTDEWTVGDQKANLRNYRSDSGYMSQNDWFNLSNSQANLIIKNQTDIWSNPTSSQNGNFIEERTKPVKIKILKLNKII